MVEVSPENRNPRLIVHRSSHQIGGNCIEIAYQGHRLILDAGSLLDGNADDAISAPASLNTSMPVDGVVVSHSHQDHYGLLRGLPESWPVWCGRPTERLMRLTAARTGDSLPQDVHPFRSFEPFAVGPFKVTPLLTDHSAFDAHMILVEVGNRKISIPVTSGKRAASRSSLNGRSTLPSRMSMCSSSKEPRSAAPRPSQPNTALRSGSRRSSNRRLVACSYPVRRRSSTER